SGHDPEHELEHESENADDHLAKGDGRRRLRDAAGIRRGAGTGSRSPPAPLWQYFVLVLRQPRRSSRLSDQRLLSRKLFRRPADFMARNCRRARRQFRTLGAALSLTGRDRTRPASAGLPAPALLRSRKRHLSRPRRPPPSVLRRFTARDAACALEAA